MLKNWRFSTKLHLTVTIYLILKDLCIQLLKLYTSSIWPTKMYHIPNHCIYYGRFKGTLRFALECLIMEIFKPKAFYLFWIWPYTTDWVCTQNGIHVFSLTHCWRGFYPDQASPRQYLCLPPRSVEDPFTTPSPSLSHTRSARPQSHSATRRSTEWESSK